MLNPLRYNDCAMRLVNYVREVDGRDARLTRLVNLHFAGYITSDEVTHCCRTLVDEDSSFGEGNATLDLDMELAEVTAEGTASPAFSISYAAALRYLPTGFHDIWVRKINPDNCYGSTTRNDSKLYGICMLEEHGFIQVGDYMIGRTVQPIVLQKLDGSTELLRETALVLPYMSKDDFLGTYPTMPAMGGGIAWAAVYDLKFPTEFLVETLGCPVTGVLRSIGAPADFSTTYPWDALAVPAQFAETRLYEG